MDVLALRDNAKYQLQQIRDVETGVEYLNKVKAIEVWAKAEKKDAELQNMVAEQKIRTQRILGQLIKDGQRRGEIAKQAGTGANQYADVPAGNVCKTLSDIGISRKESSTFQTIASIPEDSFEAFIADKKANIENAVQELTTSGLIAFAKGKPHIANNSGENEWYSPGNIVEAARIVMGNFDLDPASSVIANRIIMADNFYTKDDDGLSQKWFGNIWLNPPYSQPLISQFADAIVNKRNEYNQAIILVNNATETEWFQKIMRISDAACFITGRVKFLDPDLKPNGAPLQGQCILYIGNNVGVFNIQFGYLGICMTRIGVK
jgi:phage N-6-adenine-methyltransferase